MSEKTSIKEKLAAMGRIVRILDKLDGVTAERVVEWLHEQYEHPADNGDSNNPDREPPS